MLDAEPDRGVERMELRSSAPDQTEGSHYGRSNPDRDWSAGGSFREKTFTERLLRRMHRASPDGGAW